MHLLADLWEIPFSREITRCLHFRSSDVALPQNFQKQTICIGISNAKVLQWLQLNRKIPELLGNHPGKHVCLILGVLTGHTSIQTDIKQHWRLISGEISLSAQS